METPIQELRRRCEAMIKDNEKYNSQFHKGLRCGFKMVIEASDEILLPKEKALYSLLERASGLVGNPGTNISASTDIACESWQKDYEAFVTPQSAP